MSFVVTCVFTKNQHKYLDKWTKIGVDIGICLGNNQGNFQLHRFTSRENTAKSFRGGGYFIDSHCICALMHFLLASQYKRV